MKDLEKRREKKKNFFYFAIFLWKINNSDQKQYKINSQNVINQTQNFRKKRKNNK